MSSGTPGKDRAINGLWVPEIRVCQSDRMTEGASPGTINEKIGILSKVFCVPIEMRFLDVNSLRLVKKVSEK